MELTGSGLINPGYLNMDDYRLSSTSAAHSSADFEEILRRASSSTGGSSGDSSGSVSQTSKTNVDKTDRLYELCLELETFLVKNLLTTMRNTIQKSGLIDEGFAGKIYEDMLYDEYAKDFTKNASFGLAEQAYLQLKGL
jgi:flagellar protein FlgJ